MTCTAFGLASGIPCISIGWVKDRSSVTSASFLSVTVPAEGMTMPKCASATPETDSIMMQLIRNIFHITESPCVGPTAAKRARLTP